MSGPLGFQLARPWALLLLLALPAAAAALRHEAWRAPRLRFPPAATLRAAPGTARWRALPTALMLGALALLAVALARPQRIGAAARELSVEGIDIVIALDLSTSMRAADFLPQNRLHVAREVLKEFVGKRRTDRIGLVTFAADAYTECPLTLDHALLRVIVDGLRFGGMEDGTAIGNALATAVNRLRESDARSRVVILITDGDNNAGQISPLEAAAVARSFGIRVFTVLVGKGGLVPYPVGRDARGEPTYAQQHFPVNPALLEEIARATGGAHYSAIDRRTLEEGLNDILDRLEKSRLFEAGSFARVEGLHGAFLAPAFALAALSVLLTATRLRPFP